MKRWNQDYHKTYGQWKKHHDEHVRNNIEFGVQSPDINPYKVKCKCDVQKGRFRKIDAHDCGHARCFICHSDKYPKRTKTYQEWSSSIKMNEGIQDI